MDETDRLGDEIAVLSAHLEAATARLLDLLREFDARGGWNQVPDDPVQALRGRNEAAGLQLHARAVCPGWLGERLDVGWAIDVLHPRASRSGLATPLDATAPRDYP